MAFVYLEEFFEVVFVYVFQQFLVFFWCDEVVIVYCQDVQLSDFINDFFCIFCFFCIDFQFEQLVLDVDMVDLILVFVLIIKFRDEMSLVYVKYWNEG